MSSNPTLDQLTDQSLLDQFGILVQRGNDHTAALLRHIDAIDRRQLWASYGHPSMFDFCVSRHHMSESTAAKRIGAARSALRFPILFDMVGQEDGSESVAIGAPEAQGTVEVWDGQNLSPIAARYLVPLPAAWHLVRNFALTGAPWTGIEWESVREPVGATASSSDLISFLKDIRKQRQAPARPKFFVDLERARVCPHCGAASTRYRQLWRGVQCRACNRSLGPPSAGH